MSHDESNQPSKPQQELFRTLLTDAKFMYLSHVIEQYEVAQLHLRQNEEQHRQVRQYMEYNRLRLFELDLRQRFLLANNKTNAELQGHSGQESSSTRSVVPLARPPDPSNSPIILSNPTKPRILTKNSLPLQYYRMQSETGSSEGLHRSNPSVSKQSGLSPPAIPTVQKDHFTGFSTRESLKDNDYPHSSSKDDYSSEDISKEEKKKKHYVRDYDKFNDTDVLFERGNFSYNHPGNKNYREYVKSLQDRYITSKKNDKVAVTTRVLDYIQKECGGRFLGHDEDGGSWRELTPEEARRKVGQSLRERNKRYLPPARSRKNTKRALPVGPLPNRIQEVKYPADTQVHVNKPFPNRNENSHSSVDTRTHVMNPLANRHQEVNSSVINNGLGHRKQELNSSADTPLHAMDPLANRNQDSTVSTDTRVHVINALAGRHQDGNYAADARRGNVTNALGNKNQEVSGSAVTGAPAINNATSDSQVHANPLATRTEIGCDSADTRAQMNGQLPNRKEEGHVAATREYGMDPQEKGNQDINGFTDSYKKSTS